MSKRAGLAAAQSVHEEAIVGNAAIRASAANVDEELSLDLKNVDLDPEKQTRSSASRLASISGDKAVPGGQFIVQFYSDQNTEESRRAVAAIVGHELTEYVPDNGYIFGTTGEAAKRVLSAPGVKYVGRLLPQIKLSAALKGIEEMAASLSSGEMRHRYENLTIRATLSPRDYGPGELAGIAGYHEGRLRRQGVQASVSFSEEFRFVEATVGIHDAQAVAVAFASHNETTWVEDKTKKKLHVIPPEFWEEVGARPPGAGSGAGRRRLANRVVGGLIQTGVEGITSLWDAGLTGRGQVVGVGDSGIDWDNCLLRDPTFQNPPFYDQYGRYGLSMNPRLDHRKIIAYKPYDASAAGVNAGFRSDDEHGHGTHVVAAIAGSSDQLSGNRGMAYEAKVVFSDYGTNEGELSYPSDMDLKMAYSLGARIHSNSWGCTSPDLNALPTFCNRYGSEARQIDDFVSKNPDFLVLFAAGNDGKYGASTIGAPATCKNCLAVGAVDRADGKNKVASFSSQGPTLEDNHEARRFKPDLVAPGVLIESAASDGSTTSNNCDLRRMSGTSMATPITAGAAALVRQYLTEGWYPSGAKNPADAISSPSAALIKAMMIHSTVPVPKGPKDNALDSPPDFEQGFGALQLTNVLRLPGSPFSLFLQHHDSVQQCEEKQYFFEVGGKRPLTVTLVWTDPAGNPASGAYLMNDLDLEVKENQPGFLPMYYPNQKKKADRANNVEKVVVRPRTPNQRPDGSSYGRYSVIVRGYRVAVASPVTGRPEQEYALVVTGDDLRVARRQRPARPTCVDGIVNPAAYPPAPEGHFKGTSRVLSMTLLQPIADSDWTTRTHEEWEARVAGALGVPDDALHTVDMDGTALSLELRQSDIPGFNVTAFNELAIATLATGFELGGGYSVASLDTIRSVFFLADYDKLTDQPQSSGAAPTQQQSKQASYGGQRSEAARGAAGAAALRLTAALAAACAAALFALPLG
eukprot:tig00000870_g5135.t1